MTAHIGTVSGVRLDEIPSMIRSGEAATDWPRVRPEIPLPQRGERVG